MADVLTIKCQSVRDTFREWHADEEQLDAQLSESLSALSAYQSHLDSWQDQLCREREELRKQRDELEAEKAALESALATKQNLSPEQANELAAARDKIATLSASLVARTEELRSLDQQRADLAGELDRARAREKELQSTFDGQKRSLEQQRDQLADEVRQLRESLQRQEQAAAAHDASAPSKSEEHSQHEHKPSALHENPVLGSIVEQFGKLRQQRAIDRQASKKPR